MTNQPPRMAVDPADLAQAADDAPGCPTAPRGTGPVPQRLSPEAEAARRAALPEVARRALEEAEARKAAAMAATMPVELGGRDGPEPVRYGDWELKGLAIDF
ncbi:DUF1674 domain-containing protein [Jannaschia sp. LMIT008]|uniref:DUF1674 domain-containing protein n=1 Tax=Jannaschia maritima TaxID=3032585 RepID=UPI002810F3FB|nr:DUF1674 domain-containing protein [Jannaschia sp. LMIT008]